MIGYTGLAKAAFGAVVNESYSELSVSDLFYITTTLFSPTITTFHTQDSRTNLTFFLRLPDL